MSALLKLTVSEDPEYVPLPLIRMFKNNNLAHNVLAPYRSDRGLYEEIYAEYKKVQDTILGIAKDVPLSTRLNDYYRSYISHYDVSRSYLRRDQNVSVLGGIGELIKEFKHLKKALPFYHTSKHIGERAYARVKKSDAILQMTNSLVNYHTLGRGYRLIVCPGAIYTTNYTTHIPLMMLVCKKEYLEYNFLRLFLNKGWDSKTLELWVREELDCPHSIDPTLRTSFRKQKANLIKEYGGFRYVDDFGDFIKAPNLPDFTSVMKKRKWNKKLIEQL